jgi:hypothetical protein
MFFIANRFKVVIMYFVGGVGGVDGVDIDIIIIIIIIFFFYIFHKQYTVIIGIHTVLLINTVSLSK